MRVLKWEIPVDGGIHEIGGGKVAQVACQDQDDPSTVAVWTIEHEDGHERKRRVTAYPTGAPVDSFGSVFLGTAMAAHGRLVWHVFEHPEVAGL